MGAVTVRLFGHATAVVDGEERSIGGPRQASVLAFLALEAGRIVPLDSLIDGLWGDDPPPSAEKTVRAYLSRLRSTLAGAVQARGRGYVLDVEPGAVDALAVTDAVAEGQSLLGSGDIDAARDVLASAVATATEAPDAAAFAAPGLQPWLARLKEDRLLAMEALVEADIARGGAQAVIPRLEQLVQEHPYREQLWASLMRALYASGRQADALRAFQRARQVLVDELGVEPGEQLRQLEQAILRQDAAVASGPRAATLPTYRTSFVGREYDVERLRAALAMSHLVTVLGPGGSGKTRLVVETLASGAASPGGRPVFFIDLSRMRHDDADQLVALAAHELGIERSAALDVVGAIASWLDRAQAQPSILVLDNCEHVAGAAAALADGVLRDAPRVTVLATSRTPLDVDGEVLLRLDPLAVPTSGTRLFVQRAQAARPSIEFDDDDVATVSRIVTRLDGLPLALEMAAARLRSMSLRELARRLDQRIDDLVSLRPGRPERHASLATTIRWSYDLLTEPVQRLFRLLAVFRGGWSLAAAETAFGREPFAVDIVAAIDELVSASLVELQVQHGSGRYRFLDTVREFAGDSLGASDDMTAAFRAHAQWALALAEGNECELFSRDVDVRGRLLDGERENLLAATEWTLDNDADLGPRLAAALGWWWLLHADGDGTRNLRRALEIEQGPTIVRARLLRRLGSMRGGALDGTARGDEALAVVEEAAALAARLGDEELLAHALHNAAYMRRSRCEYAEARKLGDAAVTLRRRIGDAAGLAITLGLLADVAMGAGDFDAAASSYAECLSLMKQAGSRHGVLAVVHSMAELAALRGNDDDALALVDEASPIADDLGDHMHEALLDQVRGHVSLLRGDVVAACRSLVRAVEKLWEQQAGELLLQTLDVLVAALAQLPAGASAADAADTWMIAVALDAAREEFGWPQAPAYARLAADSRVALAAAKGDEARSLSARAAAWTLPTLVERSLAAAARVLSREPPPPILSAE